MDPSHSRDEARRDGRGEATRHRADQRYSDEELRLLVDQVTEYAIFQLDPEGHVVSWNAGAREIKGYAEEEIIGRHVSTFYTRKDIEAGVPERALENAAREGAWKNEGWRVRKGGSRFWASVTITALYGDDGELRGFAKVTRDMTDRHEREEALAREKQRAEAAKEQAEQEKRRAERENALLQLMQAVAATANDAERLEEAMQEGIRIICEYTGWPVGHVYRLRRNGEPRVAPTGIWSLQEEERFERFCAVTEEATFAVGRSLPGRVAERGEPVWIRDVTEDPDFIRSRLGGEIEVRGAFGIPVRDEGETVAVLEFFSADPEEPDEKLLEAMESVGMQLSRVAERERTRAEIRQSEERYRRLFESIDEGFCVIEVLFDASGSPSDYRFVKVNPAYEKHTGLSDVEGKRARELVPDVEPFWFQIYGEVARTGEPVRFQRKLEALDRHLDLYAFRVGDPEERKVAVLFSDITARKHTERELRESEAKFRALAEESPTGITVIQDGRFQYVNRRYAEIFGYAPEEMIGVLPVEEVVHPEDRHVVRENVRRRIEGEVDAVRFQVRGWTKDEETIDLVVTGRRFTYEGRPAVIGSVLDITERKEAERALKESEAMFRVLAENAQVGIGLIQDGIIQYVNPAHTEIFGYAPDELVGHPPTKFVHPDDHARMEEQIQKRVEEGVPDVQYKFRGLTKGGETRRIEVHGSRITYRGKPAVIGTLLDVTDRRRMQREILRIQEEERRRLGQDLHDGVASQLTGIAILLSTLARRSPAEASGLADDIREAQELVQESCEDVRRLSRGLAPAGLSGKELPSALERLADNVEEGVFEEGADLPEFESDVAAHLYWIAQEAVANARKYAEASEMAIRLLREGSAVVLEIEDDGRGFDLASVEQGGLGLRTMRYRADLLGATLTIDSAPGEGTRVRCRLLA